MQVNISPDAAALSPVNIHIYYKKNIYTIYGLDQNKFLELDSATNSMVRGEKLMDLLSLIVRFLTAHCHDSGIPAIPVAVDGTTTAQILQKLQEAPNTILNTKIRIN